MISNNTHQQFICNIWKYIVAWKNHCSSIFANAYSWCIGKWMDPDDQILHFCVYILWVSFTQQLLWRTGWFTRILHGVYKKKKKKRKIAWNSFGNKRVNQASLLLMLINKKITLENVRVLEKSHPPSLLLVFSVSAF